MDGDIYLVIRDHSVLADRSCQLRRMGRGAYRLLSNTKAEKMPLGPLRKVWISLYQPRFLLRRPSPSREDAGRSRRFVVWLQRRVRLQVGCGVSSGCAIHCYAGDVGEFWSSAGSDCLVDGRGVGLVQVHSALGDHMCIMW